MPNISALRIRHEHDIPAKLNNFDPARGFTIEAWAKFAPMDRAIRLYQEKDYAGAPLRLKAGAYGELKAQHFSGLRSVCLPEGMEAVFFSEPNYRGTALAVRNDLHDVPAEHLQAGSVVVLDRRHRRQSHVVLFEEEGYKGRAQLLLVAQEWNKDQLAAVEGAEPLKNVGSAWAPPGVALDILAPEKVEQQRYGVPHPDTALVFYIQSVRNTSQAHLWPGDIFGNGGGADLSDQDRVEVPDGEKLVVFEKNDYQGGVLVLTGVQYLNRLPWAPKSGFRYKSSVHSSSLIDGAIILREQITSVCPPGSQSHLTTQEATGNIWVPPMYRLIPTIDPKKPELPPGFHRNVPLNERYVVEYRSKRKLQGDISKLPGGTVSIQARRVKPLEGEEMPYSTNGLQKWAASWAVNPPLFSSVDVPFGHALFLFEEANFGGACEVAIGRRDDLSDLGWTPRSAVYAKAPDGVNGILCVTNSSTADLAVYAPGKTLTSKEAGSGFYGSLFIPPGYRLKPASGSEASAGYGPGYYNETLSVEGYSVERYAGIFTNNGFGLSAERQPGMLRAEGEELRFGGSTLLPGRWYHLALSWDGSTLRWILDGKEVLKAGTTIPPLDGQWVLGERFRGALAQLRVWNRALSTEQIRDLRYPGADFQSIFPDGLPEDMLEKGLSSYAAPPDAVTVDIARELPKAPLDTALVATSLHQVKAENQQKLQAAHKAASESTAQARKRAQYKIALAREKARRDIHLNGMEQIVFLRGDCIFYGSFKSGRFDPFGIGGIRFNDIIIDPSHKGQIGYAVCDGVNLLNKIDFSDKNAVADTSFEIAPAHPPMAITAEFSNEGEAPSVQAGGKLPVGIYWIEDDGFIGRLWYSPETNQIVGSHTPETIVVKAPAGRPKSWDMALDPQRRFLFWANGWEIYFKNLGDDGGLRILAPHVASPYPAAIEVAPDGSLLWLDVEDEMLKILPADQIGRDYPGAPIDLYPAPKPSRGLAVCSLADETNSGKETAFVYWVSTERRTLEAPVLDTPGRYIDLLAGLGQEEGRKQHTDIVQVVNMIGAEWQTVDCVMNLHSDIGAMYGPFSTEEGFAINIKMRLNEIPEYTDYGAIVSFLLNEPVVLWEKGTVTINSGGGVGQAHYDAVPPAKEWMDFRVEVHVQEIDSSSDSIFKVFINQKQVWHECQYKPNSEPWKGKAGFFLPLFEGIRYSGQDIPPAQGDISEVVVTPLGKPEVILARRTINEMEGKVKPGNSTLNRKILLDSPADPGIKTAKTSILAFTDPVDVVLFDPVRLDLHQGWTASAELIWDAPSDPYGPPICIYELATFEDEDRLACAIQANGIPRIYLRWEGDLLNFKETVYGTDKDDSFKYLGIGSSVKPNQQCRVTWAMTPTGLVTTYVDGLPVIEEQLSWKGGSRVFESHRLGAPNTDQTHYNVIGARYHDTDDKLTQFNGFTGKVIRFSVWNAYVPNAATLDYNLPGPDPLWDRSLITIESRRRYLHAGRTDGKEPPVTLFPIDMDSGLCIETALDQAHAELTHAHAVMAAAKQYEAHLKQVALDEAHNRLDTATENLAQTQQKARAAKEKAQQEASQKKELARLKKAEADTKAERDRADGAKKAQETKENGERQAREQEKNATDDKNRRIADANRRLDDKRGERDRKKREYEEKS